MNRNLCDYDNKPDYSKFLYNDDEPISEHKNSKIIIEDEDKKIDPELMVSLTLAAKQNYLKLTKDDVQCFPFMAKLQVKESKDALSKRAPIDIVCVIDKSGSMSGTKWEYLVQTIKDLSELLQEYDRLSIVSFHHHSKRNCKLLRMNEQGKNTINNLMKELYPSGCTNIGDGLGMAIKILSDRRQRNKVSSILLLSDGQDDKSAGYIRNIISQENKAGSYTINTFGFGNDHDSQLMTEIANQKDGNFYYIEQLEDVGVCFVDCLGQLFSIIAENVSIKIKATPPKHLSDIHITKAFGGEKMWTTSNDNVYETKILQLASGAKKNYIIELEIPPM